LEQAQKCGRVKTVNGILTSLLDTSYRYWIYNGDTDIKKNNKKPADYLPFKRLITKINDNINKVYLILPYVIKVDCPW